MNAAEYRAALQAIGWSQRGLADRLGINDTRARRWANGRYKVPLNVAHWLEKLAEAHRRCGIPEDWEGDIANRRSDIG